MLVDDSKSRCLRLVNVGILSCSWLPCACKDHDDLNSSYRPPAASIADSRWRSAVRLSVYPESILLY
jgi:hypothetical protein